MGIRDAIAAAKLVKCTKVVGVHFDTFGYIKIDHLDAKKAFANENMELILLNIGESVEI
jgi:L-ascorbate metabolism protein UlaG (beta-lactamase superfamily)